MLWNVLGKEIRGLVLVQMARFGVVGLINFGIDTGIFFLALATVTSSLVVANVLAWTVAVSSSYVMNSKFTFAEHSKQLNFGAYLAFAVTQIGGLVANTAVVLIAAPFMPLLAAKFLAVIAGFVVNFTLARLFVFRPPA
jgi:putative flippase GtrA